MRTRSLRAGALAAALLLAAGCAAAARRGEPLGRPIVISTPGEARGQVVYMKHCYHCHQGGEGGQGTVLNWSGDRTITSWPMARHSATVRDRVRTTPLT